MKHETESISYKDWLRNAYDQTAAARLNPQWSIVDKAGQVISDRLIQLANITENQTVLDIGCGIGEPALTAARHIGPTGKVIAIDLSPQMLAIASEQARDLNLNNIEFLEQDAEKFEFPPNTFNAVISRWSIMLLSDLSTTFEQINRTLLPGGHVAIASIGRVAQSSVAQTVRFVRDLMKLPERPQTGPDPFALTNRDHVQHLLDSAKLQMFSYETQMVEASFSSGKAYADWCTATQAPVRGMLAQLPNDQRISMTNEIAQFAEKEFATLHGVMMKLETILFAARKTAIL